MPFHCPEMQIDVQIFFMTLFRFFSSLLANKDLSAIAMTVSMIGG